MLVVRELFFFANRKRSKSLPPVTCHLSPGTRHMSLVTCHLSLVTCHLSPVACHLSIKQLLLNVSVIILHNRDICMLIYLKGHSPSLNTFSTYYPFNRQCSFQNHFRKGTVARTEVRQGRKQNQSCSEIGLESEHEPKRSATMDETVKNLKQISDASYNCKKCWSLSCLK